MVSPTITAELSAVYQPPCFTCTENVKTCLVTFLHMRKDATHTPPGTNDPIQIFLLTSGTLCVCVYMFAWHHIFSNLGFGLHLYVLIILICIWFQHIKCNSLLCPHINDIAAAQGQAALMLLLHFKTFSLWGPCLCLIWLCLPQKLNLCLYMLVVSGLNSVNRVIRHGPL